MMHKRGLILKHILQEELDLVAVQETIRQDFSDKELKDMGEGLDKKLVELARWLGTKVLRLDSFIF